ncbi:MAG: pyrroline-5-carboxylate reductase [Chloroflexota bacterium]|nr:MAG: pyrroline-5-carboxylate reductase [Chloroflexota bacterium]
MAGVVVIGGGAMGEAFARGMLAAGVATTGNLVVIDRSPARCEELARRFGIRCEIDPVASLASVDTVVIAVKPKSYPGLARQIADHLAPEQTVISIVAGLTIERLQTTLGHRVIIRAMPNTPAQIGAGVTAWYAASDAAASALERTEAILRSLGATARVEDESDIDIATALSGSGPAFVFLVIEAMIDAGVHCGLDRATASTLAIQTVIGAGRLAAESGSHPAALRNAVTSPGGTTAAGLAELESAGVRAAFDRAIVAAHTRSRVLGTIGVA